MDRRTGVIHFTEVNPGAICITHENGMRCGDLVMDVDGYYYWWPPHRTCGGCWPEQFLTIISTKLKELNVPMDAELDAYFKESAK
jgi:hypothetical protein